MHADTQCSAPRSITAAVIAALRRGGATARNVLSTKRSSTEVRWRRRWPLVMSTTSLPRRRGRGSDCTTHSKAPQSHRTMYLDVIQKMNKCVGKFFLLMYLLIKGGIQKGYLIFG